LFCLDVIYPEEDLCGMLGVSATMPRYCVNYDEAFLVQSLEQFRATKFRQAGRMLIKAICFLGLSALLAVCIYVKVYPLAGAFAFVIVLLLIGPRFDYWFYKRSLRKSPFFNQDVQFRIHKDGVNIQTQISDSELSWQAFTKYLRNKNGFLIFSGRTELYWLPDSALNEGTISDVETLLNQHITKYVGI
jgi:hypothetical protein